MVVVVVVVVCVCVCVCSFMKLSKYKCVCACVWGWERQREREREKESITKTRLYNCEPLKPYFYIVKLGFTGVCTIFLILLKNIDCEYSLEPPRLGGSNEYPQSMLREEI